ncbi:MAG TPA: chemotaxis protein CheW [Ktedonobacteraceae bacterium]|nr:chemotaxis protein CheW [Ktedonobacteraceae bacterium]
MLQRDAGAQPPGTMRRQSMATSHQSMGSGQADVPRGLPGNVLTAQNLADATVVGDHYLIFSLLEQDLAIKAEHIQGVERLADVTPVPNVASWVKGVINLRGSIASVVDLRVFLGMEPLPHNPRTRLLSLAYNEMVICFVVDSVSEMVPISASSILSNVRHTLIPSWLTPYAEGSALVNRRNVVILDAAKLLFSEKIQHYS